LFLASNKGQLDVVKALLEAKADVNKAASNGAAALMTASEAGYPEVVKELLNAKADVNVQPHRLHM